MDDATLAATTPVGIERVFGATGTMQRSSGGGPDAHERWLGVVPDSSRACCYSSPWRCAVKAPFLSGCESRPATVVCGRLPDCQAFLSRLVLHLLAFEVVHDNGVARQSLARAPVERGPAFRLALKGFPHGRPRQSPAGRNEVEEPRSGLTAAVDRARGRRLRA